MQEHGTERVRQIRDQWKPWVIKRKFPSGQSMNRPALFLAKAIAQGITQNEHEKILSQRLPCKGEQVKPVQKKKLSLEEKAWQEATQAKRLELLWIKLEKVYSPVKKLSEAQRRSFDLKDQLENSSFSKAVV